MKTQQQIESRVTPEIVKKMVELAGGFRCDNNTIYSGNRNIMSGFSEILETTNMFPLLIHRAVEGWNKLGKMYVIITDRYIYTTLNLHQGDSRYMFNNYQPTSLTTCELALLDCLVDVLSKEGI